MSDEQAKQSGSSGPPPGVPGRGVLFKHLQPRECSHCTKPLPMETRAIYLDVRTFTENGWMPVMSGRKREQHWYWVFCGHTCLADFTQRLIEKHIDLTTDQ